MSFTTTCSEDHGGNNYNDNYGVYNRDCFGETNTYKYAHYTSADGIIAASFIPGTKVKS